MDEQPSPNRRIAKRGAIVVLGALLLAAWLFRIFTVGPSLESPDLPSGTLYAYSSGDNARLTEQVALEFTKKAALDDDGRASETMTPVPYCELKHPGEHTELLFARTLDNPNAGFVLWSAGIGNDPWDYLVTIEKEDGKVECTVHRNTSVR